MKLNLINPKCIFMVLISFNSKFKGISKEIYCSKCHLPNSEARLFNMLILKTTKIIFSQNYDCITWTKGSKCNFK